MTISPIAAIAPVSAATASLPASSVNATSAASSSGAVSGSSSASGGSGDFATMLGNGIDALSDSQNTASNLAIQAATGQLTDPAQYTAAATQATLMTQLATSIQSKAVDAFNTIMGLQA